MTVDRTLKYYKLLYLRLVNLHKKKASREGGMFKTPLATPLCIEL